MLRMAVGKLTASNSKPRDFIITGSRQNVLSIRAQQTLWRLGSSRAAITVSTRTIRKETHHGKKQRALELSEVKEAEDLRDDAIARILEQDSTYLLPDSLARLEGHQETISIVPYNNDGVYGSHNYEHGKTEIELIKALPSTMRLTAIHEYEHVASYHNEIVEKHHNSTLHTVQVGLRTKEYIVDRDGERLLYRNEGENLNEGLTQYLTEDKLSAEELSMAQAMRIYPFATEAAASLSDILGSASIREDFYEGTSHIRDALDETLGQGTFQRFCSCLDQASESPESDQRREAMREANKILNTLAARKAAEKQNKEA